MKGKFDRQIEIHEDILERITPAFDFAGYIKIILVVALAVSLYFSFSKNPMFILISALILVVLVALWIYHDGLYEKINYSKGIIEINHRYLARISGEWTAFDDTGEDFVDSMHAYAADLDIVGKKSLFQFLNVAGTWHGRRAFSRDLLSADYTGSDLLKRQKAVLELSEDIEFSNRAQYYLSCIGAGEFVRKLTEELKDGSGFIKNRALKSFLAWLPLPVCLFVAGSVIFQQKALYHAGATLVLAQALLWIAGLPKVAKYLNAVTTMPRKLNLYGTVIEVLNGENFTSEKLREIQNRLGGQDLSALMAMKELDKIAGMISARQNVIIYFILNIFLLWDYECAFRFEAWKRKYAGRSEEWFLALGEFESLLSFSILPNVCGNVCLPVPEEKQKAITAKDAGHPLIPDASRVNNDFELRDNIFIVSGSNMSGKTTFLRTVGINLVLARAGGFVCAREMLFFPFKPVTSMRIVDDLNEGVSMFYAELKRIKNIIEMAKEEKNIIFLIDEIFKGTNSVDRRSGARAVLSNLSALGAVGLITTHDLELCDLEEMNKRIKNYSFSEYYTEGKINFDYKMKSGKSTAANAKYLMKMVGIDL